MDRIVSPNGSPINLEKTINDLQTKVFGNLTKRISQISKTRGVVLDVKEGVPNNALQVGVSGGNVTIAPGLALTKANDYINVSSTTNAVNLASSNIDTLYGVTIKYTEAGTDAVAALNAFVYDALGGASLSKKTVFSDSFVIELLPITGTVSAFLSGLPSDTIALAAIYSDAGAPTIPADLTNYTSTGISGFQLADLRPVTRLLIDESILDESKVFLKDRASTGANAVQGDVEFLSDINAKGSVTLSADGIDYTLAKDGAKIVLSSPTQGNIMEFFIEDNTAKLGVSALKVDDLKVLSEGSYRDILVTGPNSTVPRNLRIHDIYPTENPIEKNGYVEIR